MGSTRQSTENPTNDLKKLFSAHVQENFVLHRHKTDLDYAKVKKLRELNFTENAFLRKYDKYTLNIPSRACSSRSSRRSSIDASILRIAEANATSRPSSRSDEITTGKSLGRDVINGNYPYSFDTWNMMVDTEQNIIDAYKKDILYGTSKAEKNNNNNNKDMLKTKNHEQTDNKVVASLQRRRSLKPIEVNTISEMFDDNVLDTEIQDIQGIGRKRTLKAARRFSVDSSIKLPNINKNISNKQTQDPRRQSLSNPDLRDKVSNEKNNKIVKKIPRRRASLFDHPAVPEIKVTDFTNEAQRLKALPRPVANATVFIQGEPSESECKSPRADSEIDASESRLSNVSFPTIPQSQSILRHSSIPHDSLSVKSVTFDDQSSIRQRSGSDCSSIRSSSKSNISVSRTGRRQSMTSTTLQLMVDSHHGAAKLRYIALLATEMEREEAANHSTIDKEPEQNIYKELSKCRYLRATRRKESGSSNNSDVM